MPSKTRLELWPQTVECYLHDGPEVAIHNADLRQIAIDNADRTAEDEVRAYDLHAVPHRSVAWLRRQFKDCANTYLRGLARVEDVTIRAVVMEKGSHINTHTEARESDLLLAYWLGGDVGPLNSKPDNTKAPAFILEDGTRHLTDLRLPFEDRHSIMLRPQPGLLVVGPAHLPHNLLPYMGDDPFIHIVAQCRAIWPDGYDKRW